MPGDPSDAPPTLSVVVPVHNEQEAFALMAQRLRPTLDRLRQPYEVVAVDDGSSDGTAALLRSLRRDWPQLRIIGLRRNCGQQAALTAGLRRAKGDFIASIDADLRDPPEKIPEMLELAQRDGLDIVYGVPAGGRAGDFRLLSRAIVEVLRSLPEHQPVYRLLVPWIGFPSAEVSYVRAQRVAGGGKSRWRKAFRWSADSLTVPLRLVTWLGMISFIACLLLIVAFVAVHFFGRTVPGWTSLAVAAVLVGGIQLFCLGVLGEYVGRIYQAVQGRPSYFIGYDSDVDSDLEVGAPEAPGTHRPLKPVGVP